MGCASVFGMHVAVLCLCPCVITPIKFTCLPTGDGLQFFGVCSNKQINQQTTDNNNTNNYNPYLQYQHTNTSLQDKIPHPKYTLNIQIHPLQNNIDATRSRFPAATFAQVPSLGIFLSLATLLETARTG